MRLEEEERGRKRGWGGRGGGWEEVEVRDKSPKQLNISIGKIGIGV